MARGPTPLPRRSPGWRSGLYTGPCLRDIRPGLGAPARIPDREKGLLAFAASGSGAMESACARTSSGGAIPVAVASCGQSAASVVRRSCGASRRRRASRGRVGRGRSRRGIDTGPEGHEGVPAGASHTPNRRELDRCVLQRHPRPTARAHDSRRCVICVDRCDLGPRRRRPPRRLGAWTGRCGFTEGP